MKNTSHAVMAQRTEAADSPDDLSTPPWATRALIEHVQGRDRRGGNAGCLLSVCAVNL